MVLQVNSDTEITAMMIDNEKEASPAEVGRTDSHYFELGNWEFHHERFLIRSKYHSLASRARHFSGCKLS
jgi:hypothetical protein